MRPVSVITNFFERKEQKRLLFEQRALLELTLSDVAKSVRKSFFAFTDRSEFVRRELEETSIDTAIDAYLNGVSYSKFYDLGETEEQVSKRARKELNEFIEMLYDYWMLWSEYDDLPEELHKACQAFVEQWWRIGFQKGIKLQRLKRRWH